MLAIKQDQVLVACPHCGHRQSESRSAFSTNCQKCRQYFRVQEALHPAARSADRKPRHKLIHCFECGAELEVPESAESTMCKWCSRYVDLHTYRITQAIAKNFKTKGGLIIEPKGLVFNTESVAGEIILRGKFHGKLTAEKSLTIYSGAEIKGTQCISHLVIPAGNHFRLPAPLKTITAEIAGELSGTLHATGVVRLKSTAHWFGNLTALALVIEEGAVIDGTLRIGSPPDNAQTLLI